MPRPDRRLAVVALPVLMVLGGNALRPSAGADHPKPCHEPDEGVRGACVALTHYLQAHATGLRSHAEAAFYPEARMVWVADGERRERPIGDYIAGFDGRSAGDESERRRWVERVEVAGDAAIATIVLDYPRARIVDYMTLLRTDGEWRIIHKSFHATPKPAG